MEKAFAEMKRVDTLITKEEKRLNRKGRKKALEYESQLLMGGFHAEPKEKPVMKKKKRK